MVDADGGLDPVSAWVLNNLIAPFMRRHPIPFAIVDVLVGCFLAFIAIALLSIGDWGGAFLFHVTLMMFWLAYVLVRGTRDAR